MKGWNIMNKELIKLDNNTGIVSNELGTLNIVKTNNTAEIKAIKNFGEKDKFNKSSFC